MLFIAVVSLIVIYLISGKFQSTDKTHTLTDCSNSTDNIKKDGVANKKGGNSYESREIDWYKFKPVSKSYWNISFIDNNKCEIKSNRYRQSEKRILVVLQEKIVDSTVGSIDGINPFEITLNKILDVFAKDKIGCTLTVFCLDNKNIHRKMALLNELNETNKNSNIFDLIISIGSESTDFLYKQYKGNIPVVTACSKDPGLMGYLGNNQTRKSNFAFTSLNVPVDIQINQLKIIYSPENGREELKNIAIIYDVDNDSAIKTQVKPLEQQAKCNKIKTFKVGIKEEQDLETNMKKVLGGMKATDKYLEKSLFWITGCTKLFDKINLINKYSEKVPVLSAVPDVVRAGDESAILSIGISFENNACLAAQYAVDVLRGSDPGRMEVGVIYPPDMVINLKKAEEANFKIPLGFIERANLIFDYTGKKVREFGKNIKTIKVEVH